MKRYIVFFGLAILLIVISVFIFTSRRKAAPISAQNDTALAAKTYVNKYLGYSIEYPNKWVVEDNSLDVLNNDVRIRPENPEMLAGMPADYIHIRLENSSLADTRRMYASKVGGNDMVESKIMFAGQAAYFYSHPDYPTSPTETTPSVIFRKIILEHNGKVISIITHKYQLPEVKQALDSFEFVPNDTDVGDEIPTEPSVQNLAEDIADSSSQEIAPGQKMISWCGADEYNEEKRIRGNAMPDKNSFWIYSQYFNGMNHGPTIRHVCHEDKELFFLQMDWGMNTSTYTGKLISVNSLTEFMVTSTEQDPEFELLESGEESQSDNVRISIDGKIVFFDAVNNKFSN